MRDDYRFNADDCGAVPLNPESRLWIWERLHYVINDLCENMEEVADGLDGKPWLRPNVDKDISADDFRSIYNQLCTISEKIEARVNELQFDAEMFEFNQHCDYLRDLGLEPITFDAFADKHDFDIACHPQWVAEFKIHQDISVEDTRHACKAFLEDWTLHRKKDAAGFWQYLPPSKRKED